MRKDRDKQLGDALRRLPAPAHREGFFETVWTGIGTVDGGASAWRPERRSLRGVLIRAPRRPRLALAAVVAVALVAAVVLFGLPAGKRVTPRFTGGSAAQGPVLPGPEPARAVTAAQLLRTVQRTLRSVRIITADYAFWEGDPGDKPGFDYDTHLILAADGSRLVTTGVLNAFASRSSEGAYGSVFAYDATTGVSRFWTCDWRWGHGGIGWPVPGTAPDILIESGTAVGLPPGPPEDETLATESPSGAGIRWELLGAVARVARTAPHRKVRTAVFDGRPVWTVSCRLAQDPAIKGMGNAPSVERLAVSVDRQTGLPVRVRRLVGGKVVAEARLRDVQSNDEVAEDTFTPGLPTAARVAAADDDHFHLSIDCGASRAVLDLPSQSFDPKKVSADDVQVELRAAPDAGADGHYTRVPLEGVRLVLGRAPLIPTWLPGGFLLQAVAVRTECRPSEADIVVLHYGSGFRSLTVTTRKLDRRVTPERFSLRTDPFGSGWPGSADSRSRIRVRSGAFSGAEATVVVGALTIPHLWAVKDNLLLTVGGDASASQLRRIAESMRTWTRGESSEPRGDGPPPK
jgi:hypothetical protein